MNQFDDLQTCQEKICAIGKALFCENLDQQSDQAWPKSSEHSVERVFRQSNKKNSHTKKNENKQSWRSIL